MSKEIVAAQAVQFAGEGNNDQGDNKERLTSPNRDMLVEQWQNAPSGISSYEEGEAFDDQGNTYKYNAGVRLSIGDEPEVMDSCQEPWAAKTVNNAFFWLDQNQVEKGSKQNVRVLERGFGIGLIAKYTMEELRKRGGAYTVIELNKGVNEYIKKTWMKNQETISRASAASSMGGIYTGPNVTIELIKGDAVKETKRLVGEGRKFDVIISDTFPLSQEEKSVNDLLDLEILVRCLDPNGVFGFFGYYAGSQGGIGPRQEHMVKQYFREIHVTPVTVNPPPDYKYFLAPNPVIPNGMIREIPVVICLKPRVQSF